jgi:hypothetical protein
MALLPTWLRDQITFANDSSPKHTSLSSTAGKVTFKLLAANATAKPSRYLKSPYRKPEKELALSAKFDSDFVRSMDGYLDVRKN